MTRPDQDAVRRAREAGVCRICGELIRTPIYDPTTPAMTTDCGREYAHFRCLAAAEARKQEPVFHKLWGKAKGHSDYDKAEWMQLQAELETAEQSRHVEALKHAKPDDRVTMDQIDGSDGGEAVREAMKRRQPPAAPAVEVYSRPDCPFRYCDVDYTHGPHVCKEADRCRYALPNAEAESCGT